jgi:hypothetical protein
MEKTQFADPKYFLLTTSEKPSLTTENRENLAMRLNCRRIQINPNTICLFDDAYLITLSARYRTDCGIFNPICVATFRLMTDSKFFGCSTGRSPGLAPF